MLFFQSTCLYAGEIKVAENPVPTSSYAVVTYSGIEAGDNVAWDVYPEPTRMDDFGGGKLTFNGPAGTRYRVTADVVNFDKKTRDRKNVYVTIGGTTPVPPGPNPPGPNPPVPPTPDPNPQPVTSFRVVLVYESGQTLSATQTGILYGAALEKALDDACVGNASFVWRRLDKDADPARLPDGLRQAWAATKPNVTQTPCIAFQVNDKITIEPFPITAADAVALVKKYRGK